MTESSGPQNHPRNLIVNADDFGLTEGINRGIVEAHENGIVTSASLMVRQTAAADAAARARAHPELSVGLHFDASESRYRNGAWECVYERVNARDADQLRRELKLQLAEFERLLDRAPTHLDSHQHIHRSEPARTVLADCANQLQIPLRGYSGEISYRGDFYGQTSEGAPFPEGLSVEQFRRIIASPAVTWTEMGCHPGYADGITSVYASERAVELQLLCDPQLKSALTDRQIQLASFIDFSATFAGLRGAALHLTIDRRKPAAKKGDRSV